MNRTVQNGIVAIIGVIAITATLNGLYLNFVKPGLQIPLLLSGALLVLIALHGTYAAEWRRRPPAHSVRGQAAGGEDAQDAEDAAEHHHHPRIGWLLLVPFLVLGVATPPPLGSYAARNDSGLVSTVQSAEGLSELSSAETVSISLGEYSARAMFDDAATLEPKTFRLQGFVAAAGSHDGWTLTRMALNCCAADGYAIKVDVRGGDQLEDDTWLEVEGTWVPTPGSPAAGATEVGPAGVTALPILQITSMRPIDQPANPYDG